MAHDSASIVDYSLLISNTYDQQLQHEQALAFAQRARRLLPRHAGTYLQARLASCEGNAYFHLGKLNVAEKKYHEALAGYLKLGLRKEASNSYSNLANVLLDQKRSAEGHQMLKKALRLFQETNDMMGEATVINNLGSSSSRLGQLREAEGYYKQAYELAKKLKNTEMLLDVAGNLYLVYKAQQRLPEALKYLEIYSDLHETRFDEKRSLQIAEMQQKYEADKAERENQLLQKENELKAARLDRRTTERNATVAGLLVTLLLALIIIRNVRQRQRAATQLAAQQEELGRQKVRELLHQQELISVHSMLQGQEEERMRIAQDLHDRLGSLLATVKLYFHLAKDLRSLLPQRQQEQHTLGSQLLDEACQEVRRIAHNMVSGVLTKFGLVVALQDLAQAVTRSDQLQMKVITHGLEGRLENHMEITLYRIVQELLSNVLKHAKATEITVQLIRNDNILSLLMEDNGIGFDPAKGRNGMGLQNIEARTSQLHGTLSVDSGLGSGTTISIEIPLPRVVPLYTTTPKSAAHDQTLVSR